MRIRLPRDLILTFISIVAGILAGIVIASVYYEKSIQDMKTTSAERARVEQLLLRGIESLGTVTYERDEAGRVVGVRVELNARVEASSNTSSVDLNIKNTGKQKNYTNYCIDGQAWCPKNIQVKDYGKVSP